MVAVPLILLLLLLLLLSCTSPTELRRSFNSPSTDPRPNAFYPHVRPAFVLVVKDTTQCMLPTPP